MRIILILNVKSNVKSMLIKHNIRHVEVKTTTTNKMNNPLKDKESNSCNNIVNIFRCMCMWIIDMDSNSTTSEINGKKNINLGVGNIF